MGNGTEACKTRPEDDRAPISSWPGTADDTTTGSDFPSLTVKGYLEIWRP